MQIEQEKQEDKLIIKLSGTLTTSTAPGFQDFLDEHTKDVKQLIIDMEQLEYITSAGLRVLLKINRKMKEDEGSMIVQHANEQIMEIFVITGFNEILNIQ